MSAISTLTTVEQVALQASAPLSKAIRKTKPPRHEPRQRALDEPAEAPSSTGSLLRGLSLVEALAEAPSPVLLVELAERVRLDSSTVYRLLQILVQEGYAVRLSSKRYCAGPRAIRLLSTYHPVNSLCNEVEAALHELRDRVAETIMLIIFVGMQRVIVKVVQGREILSPSYETWLRTPLHGSASGKIMLMQMSLEKQQEALGPPPYAATTEHTVRDAEALREQLAQARTRGFVVARDDALVGMTALAAPITWNGRALACLAIVGSTLRLGPKMEEPLGSALRETAKLIVNGAPAVRTLAHFVGV